MCCWSYPLWAEVFPSPHDSFFFPFPRFFSKERSGSGHPKQLQRTKAASLSHGNVLKAHLQTQRHTETIWSGSNWSAQGWRGRQTGQSVTRMKRDCFPVLYESSESSPPPGCIVCNTVIKLNHLHPPSSHRVLLQIHYQHSCECSMNNTSRWKTQDESHTHT